MRQINKKGKKNELKYNTHYNRYESATDHTYASFNYSSCPYLNSQPIEARIKCRLVHMKGNSVVIPDFIILDNGGWIQPLFFTAPYLVKLDEQSHLCDFFIDIQEGQTIKIRIHSNGFIKEFTDKSHLYKCEIYGPNDIEKYSCGEYSEENGQMLLHLFHHTDDKGFDGINSSNSFWTSKWNYRGNKECVNYNFVYFTHIPEITYNSDLIAVAMSADGNLDYMIDSFIPPAKVPPNFREVFKDYLYTAKVYRSTSNDRNCTIEIDVPIESIDIKHLYLHNQGNLFFYEVCFPYIHRIKTLPKSTVFFDDDLTLENKPPLVHSEYAIIGDARSKSGLAAPFDEEDTSFIFKIEDCKGQTIHQYWFTHGNQDLFTSKGVEVMEVQDVKINPTNK